MCGIVGIVNLNGEKVYQDLLLKMREIMIHRGPDDGGMYLNKNVGLAHRRLSIIDLSGGRQPMCNEDGTIWIVYNGEVYNYKELQRQLEQKGHVFKTSCDTETILHLYEEDGIDCVKKLNGMFAFAIWDESKRRLFLTRDRLGVKPLYYCVTSEAFLFASEIKVILEYKDIPRECNEQKIPEYLAFRFVAGEDTLFKGIFNLLPGHVLVLEDNKVEINRYWEINNRPLLDGLDENDYLDNLSYLLKDSIRLRLRSDVPLGTFCSGGVDSSLVTALAASKCEFPLNTFSVGFKEKEYDERRYAQLVSEQNQTRHHELIVSNCEFADTLQKLIWFNDEPLNHPNSVQLFLISKYAKNLVTVILTGEGADELLGGYPRYFIPLLVLRYHNLPKPVKVLIKSFLPFFQNRKANKIKEAFEFQPQEMAVYNSSFTDRMRLKDLFSSEINPDFSYRFQSFGEESWNHKDFFKRFFLSELKTYLVSILNRQDKMTMAASIESRVPFLDYRLVEFCSAIPYQWKLKGFKNKYLLKRLAEKHLPYEVVYRKKSGFGVPISSWLRDPKGMGRYLDILQDTRFKQRGYFNQSQVDQLIFKHQVGKEDHGEILWALINFELWHRTFIDCFTI